jgi:hypothetical protein
MIIPSIIMGGVMSEGQKESARVFWGAFQSCLEEVRIRPDAIPQYIKWAQAFVRFYPGKGLRERTSDDIRAFLTDLQKQKISEWKMRQAEHALKVLYEDFLPGYIPIPQENTHSFRDHVMPGEVERRYQPLLSAIRTEMRNRHYSIRTETTYLDWARRFIAFHHYTHPSMLDGTSVKEFLNYLAVERKVAGSDIKTNPAMYVSSFP